MSDIDTSNDFGVGVLGDDIAFLKSPIRCTRAHALRLAAWIVVLAEDEPGEFNKVLEAVKNT